MKIPKALWVVGAMVFFEGTACLLDSVHQRSFEGARVRSMFFSPDGKTLYGGGSDLISSHQRHGWLWAWNTDTGRLLWKTEIPESTYPLKLSPNGATLLVEPPNGRLQFWDTSTGQPRCTLETGPPRESLEKVSFASDSQCLLGGFQSGIQVWDVRTGRQKAFWKIPKGKTDWLHNIQFSADGERVLVGVSGSTQTFQLWDSRRGRLLCTFKETASVCALSPSGKRVAFVYSAPSNPTSHFWMVVHDAHGGALKVQSAEFSAHFTFESLEFVSEDNLLCKGGDGRSDEGGRMQTFLWEIRRNRITEQLTVKEDIVFSSDKRLQAVANRGGYQNRPPLVTLYNIARGGVKLRDLEGLAGR